MKTRNTIISLFIITTLFAAAVIIEGRKQRWLRVNKYPLDGQRDFPIVESESPFHKTTQLSPYESVSEAPFNHNTFGELFTMYKDSFTPQPPGTTLKRSRRNIVPTYVGTFTANKAKVEWSAPCFQNNVGSLTVDYKTKSVVIEFESRNATSLLCSDWYLFATQETMHIKASILHGRHTFTLHGLLDSDLQFVMNRGMFGFVFEDGLLGTVIDAYFAGRALYDTWFQQDKIQFLHNNMPDFNFDKRPVAYTPVLDTSEIGNGDLLGVVTLSGLDVILMYGTGGHIGHVATTLWIPVNGKKELFVVEAYDVGIIRTPYAQWIADHAADGRIVILGKLRQEFAQKMNVTKAIDFFLQNEGLPYGYENIAFAWIDSLGGNYPTPLDEHLIPSALTIFDKLSNYWVNVAFLSGINQRFQHVLNVNKQCNTVECVVDVVESLNMTVQELLTIPESDTWRYNGSRAMVCSVFIMTMFKESGVLNGYQLEATEFTPKDLYMLDVWDKQWKRPSVCLQNGDNYPYCQMLGEWFWPLPDYAAFSSIPLYSHMNERCTAKPPTYTREPSTC